MAASVLGKRTRGDGLPTKRTRRLTRNFQQGNDENQDPNEASAPSDVEEDSADEESATFSPAVTRTPSARRTRSLYQVEAVECRECIPAD